MTTKLVTNFLNWSPTIWNSTNRKIRNLIKNSLHPWSPTDTKPKPHFVFVFITIPFPSFSLSPHYSVLPPLMYPRFLITSTSIQWFSSELFSLCTCAHRAEIKAAVYITQTQRRILLMIFFRFHFLSRKGRHHTRRGEFCVVTWWSAWQRINKDSHKRARNGARLIFSFLR